MLTTSLYVTIHLIQYPLYMLTVVPFYITSPLYYNPLHTSISIYNLSLYFNTLLYLYLQSLSIYILYHISIIFVYNFSLYIPFISFSISPYHFYMKINMNIYLMKMSIKCIKYVYLCTNVYVLIINELHYFFYI